MEGMGELMEEVGKEEEKDGAEAEGSGDGGAGDWTLMEVV